MTAPYLIGACRAASEIRRGWHVRLPGRTTLALVEQDAVISRVIVSSGAERRVSGLRATTVVRAEDGHSQVGASWIPGQLVWTRTPGEQLRYVEARHAQMLADAGLEKYTLSGAPRRNRVVGTLWISGYEQAIAGAPAPHACRADAAASMEQTATLAGWGTAFSWRRSAGWEWLFALDDEVGEFVATGLRIAPVPVPAGAVAR